MKNHTRTNTFGSSRSHRTCTKGSRSSRKTQPGHSELILFIDQEKALRWIIPQILEANGYRTLTAANIDQASALCGQKGNDIDLVMANLQTPGTSEAETIIRIRKVNPAARIVLATEASDTAEFAGQLQPDVFSVLNKPFNASMLFSALDAALHTPRR